MLKVEIGVWFVLRDHPRKRGLAALARTQKSRNGVNAENAGNALSALGRGIISEIYIIENQNVK